MVNGEEQEPQVKQEEGDEGIARLAENHAKWTKNNKKAIEIFYNSLANNVKPTLINDCAKARWDNLQETDRRRTRAGVDHLVPRLVDYRKKPDKPMQRFLQ